MERGLGSLFDKLKAADDAARQEPSVVQPGSRVGVSVAPATKAPMPVAAMVGIGAVGVLAVYLLARRRS